jgi:ABC-type bacteriocin/lantibiotic exporter with double-glycine peptidase domain
MDITYNSKIDRGIILPILVVLFVVGLFMTLMKIWIGFLVILLLLTFIIHMLLTTQYKIVGRTLKVKSGVFVNKVVNIDTISKIIETNSTLSSPANSLDRLELRYNKFERIIISPKDKNGFIKTLSELKPDIDIQLKK